jgi:hypothetical protein
MNDLQYHITNPQNTKDLYNEYDNIDFKIAGVGRALVAGSVRLLADVEVSANTDIVPVDQDDGLLRVCYDGFLGAHSFIDTITTSFDKLGVVENIRFYPRYVSAIAKASLTKEDLINSAYVCEGRTPSDIHANLILKGYTTDTTATSVTEDTFRAMDFCVKPKICLNNTVGPNSLISLDKNGDCNLSFTVPRSVSVLYGDPAIGSTKIFSFSNYRLVYNTVTDSTPTAATQMMIETDLKQSIQSSNATISTKAPIVANAFFMTFIRQADENQPLVNGMENQRLPNVERFETAYNDSLSIQYRYDIDNEEQILTNYVNAVSAGLVGDNNCGLNVLASNDSYGFGLAFGSFIDLSKSKISVRIQSAVSSSDPYVAYMFFTGITTI